MSARQDGGFKAEFAGSFAGATNTVLALEAEGIDRINAPRTQLIGKIGVGLECISYLMSVFDQSH
jgi:hypothetical protein